MSHDIVAQIKKHLLAELGCDVQDSFPERRTDRVADQRLFAKRYLAYCFDRKVEPFARKRDVPREVLRRSLTAFAEAEHRCLLVNRFGKTYTSIIPAEQEYFIEAKRLATLWISKVLLDVWPDWGRLRYTGGASRACSRRQSHPALKWAGFAERGNLSATQPALDFLLENGANEILNLGCVDIVEDSRFDFVAKTARTVRFMAMEAELNQMAQSLLGDTLRYALKRFDINLDDQRPNQELAYLGSVTKNRATLDQTSASDCIALALLEMLPSRWQGWLMSTRSPSTSVGGRVHTLEKIATMGNGFIFELQSLLFAAFAHACTTLSGGRECDIAVFGDDIVCSTQVAQPLMDTLEYYGLIPNMEKSYFGDDPFRESCGKHYYAGYDVTPFYVKEPLTKLSSLFRCYNGLRDWSERTGIHIPNTLAALVKLIPRRDRVVVPRSYSNTCGLYYPVSGCTLPRRVIRHGEALYAVKCLELGGDDITDKLDDEVRYLDWLREQPASILEDSVWQRFPTAVLRSSLPGCPRELKVYSRGPEHEALEGWVAREGYWAERL